MQGNVQIEILNSEDTMIACHLRDCSEFDKQLLIMSLAKSLDLTPTDILLTSIMYPDFLEHAKSAKSNLSNNRSTSDQ